MTGGRIAALVALVSGVVLIAVAAPRTMSGLHLAADRDVIVALGRGERPAPAALVHAVAGHEAALRWFDDAATRTDLAALQLARAGDPTMPTDLRRAILDEAIRNYRRGLVRGPARTFAWAQYAEASFARDGARARLAPALKMSLATGRYDPRLAAQRAELGFRAARTLDDETRRAIRAQVPVAAAGATWHLANFAQQRYALGWVRAALADDPALLRRFEASYLRQFNR